MIKQRADAAFAGVERQNADNIWEELSEFMLNNQSGSFKAESASSTSQVLNVNITSPGGKKTRRLFDSTALQAVQDLASSFQGTLTNPATVWSNLRFQTDQLNDDDEASRWLDEVNRTIHQKLAESNFNTEIAKSYQSFVALANMVILLEEIDGKFRFTSTHLSQVAWTEDKNGMVDTLYRKFTMTAKQAFQKWGTKVNDKILKALEKAPESEYSFLHAIFPRDEKKVKLNEFGLAPGDKRPIASLYIDISHGDLIDEDGYYESPMMVARWSLTPGEKYGRGPSHLALPAVRTLNKLEELDLQAYALQVRPPIFANQRDVFGQLDMRPGQISIVKNHQGIKEFTSQARSDIKEAKAVRLAEQIRSIFFLDKLLLPPRTETGEMTAFEVSQRIEQMHRVLGPTLSRLNHEFLNPLIVRAFKILLRTNQLPPVPEILQEQGINIDIVFVNQLARAQQIQDVSTIQQWVQGIAGLAQFDQSVLDNVNIDGIAKHTAKVLGVPEAAVQSSKMVQQIREQRAQAQQAAAQSAQLDMVNKAADAAAKLPT